MVFPGTRSDVVAAATAIALVAIVVALVPLRSYGPDAGVSTRT
jgi:hypothetical protein